MASATSCPDCGAPTVSYYAARPKRCDDCFAERRRAARAKWVQQNPERAKEVVRAYKASHREEIRAKGRIVISRNLICADCGAGFLRMGSRGRFPKWCPDCRAVRNAQIAADYRARHPEKARDAAKVGSARRRGAARMAVETVRRRVVFERDGWICQLCDQPVKREAVWPDPQSPSLDHVIPLSKGGDHTYANVQLACLRCNLRKNDRLIEKVI